MTTTRRRPSATPAAIAAQRIAARNTPEAMALAIAVVNLQHTTRRMRRRVSSSTARRRSTGAEHLYALTEGHLKAAEAELRLARGVLFGEGPFAEGEVRHV